MPNFSIKPTQSKVFLSWESTYQLLQDVKQPHTRTEAFNTLLQAHADNIAAMCRSTVWAKQWGFEDAYQEAVMHFFETALHTANPADLESYWNLRNAVRTGAAKNIYPMSVSPYLAQKLQSNSFSKDLDFVSEPRSELDTFDDIGWHSLKAICQKDLTKRQRLILEFICQTPGDIPTVLELAAYLNLSKASAQRTWNYFQDFFKNNTEIIRNLHHSVGLDFLKAYFQDPINHPVSSALERKASGGIKVRIKRSESRDSAISVLGKLVVHFLQPLANPDSFINWRNFTQPTYGFGKIYSKLFRDKPYYPLFKSPDITNQVFSRSVTDICFTPPQLGIPIQSKSTRRDLSAYFLFKVRIIDKKISWLYLQTDILEKIQGLIDWLILYFQKFADLYWQISLWSITCFRPVRGSPFL